MAGPIKMEKVTEAIGVLVDFYEQEVENNQLKENGELKQRIEELKANPEFQKKLGRKKKKGGACRQLKQLETCDKKFHIGKYSRIVALMVRLHFKGQDDSDDDDEDEAC